MADMKSELTARINENKENDEQMINKCINKIDEEKTDTIGEIKYNRKLIDQLNPKVSELEKKVNNIEEYINDKFQDAISVAVQNKLKDADIEFIKDMIKKNIDDRTEDNITEIVDAKIEDKTNDVITNIIEPKLRDVRAELVTAHTSKSVKDQEADDNISQKMSDINDALQVSFMQMNALSGEFTSMLLAITSLVLFSILASTISVILSSVLSSMFFLIMSLMNSMSASFSLF